MSVKRLRLRVDPPYDGESISSFVGRAAQSYSTPVRSLLSDLTGGKPPSKQKIDLDRNPSNELLEGLGDAVHGWNSSLDNMKGFNHWVLAPSERYAYCPLCFKEDLEGSRVPYFRNDWMAALTTNCWKHRTPMFNWLLRSPTYGRQLPKDWILRSRRDASTYPEFFMADLHALEEIAEAHETLSAETPFPVSKMLSAVAELQYSFEKSVVAPMSDVRHCLIARRDCDVLQALVLFAIDKPRRLGWRVEPIAEVLRPTNAPRWFGAAPNTLRPREFGFEEYAIRLCGDVTWRRTFLWFVARTLAGHPQFATRFRRCRPWRHWKEWWNLEIREAASKMAQGGRFQGCWEMLCRVEDEVCPRREKTR